MKSDPHAIILAVGIGWIGLTGAHAAQAADAAAGSRLWHQAGMADPDSGRVRRCGTCHGEDPSRPGQHARTGKRIEPMAHSAAPSRYADAAKVEKWFLRNCKWTFGRTCTQSEKSDLLAYLMSL